MSYKRYALIAYILIALLFSVWLHAADSQTQIGYQFSRGGTVVAFASADWSRITFTGAPILVCVELPEHRERQCVSVDVLQSMFRERFKTP